MCFPASLSTSSNSGELSPLLKYRVDLEIRFMGVETMENMLVKPQGVALRRPGTIFVVDTYSPGHYGYGEYGEGIYGN